MKQTYSRSSPFRAACATALMGLAALSALAQSAPYPILPPDATYPSPPVEALPSLPSQGQNTDATLPDRKAERFITKVSMLQSEESRVSTIAAQRASNDQVRTFAGQVSTANQAREQELAQLAQRRNVTLPTGRDPRDAAEENQEWQNKDTKDFDQDYVQRIIKIQKSSIDALEDCAKAHDSDPELAAFAQKHLQALRDSLQQAESMKKQID